MTALKAACISTSAPNATKKSPQKYSSHEDLVENILSQEKFQHLQETIQLLDEAGVTFDHESVLKEKQTPVFFGSALTNFGVRMFLDAFIQFAPPPQPYPSDAGAVSPEDEEFRASSSKFRRT
jgi:peptide chain release factor 3